MILTTVKEVEYDEKDNTVDIKYCQTIYLIDGIVVSEEVFFSHWKRLKSRIKVLEGGKDEK